jgi:hypothetical protein
MRIKNQHASLLLCHPFKTCHPMHYRHLNSESNISRIGKEWTMLILTRKQCNEYTPWVNFSYG